VWPISYDHDSTVSELGDGRVHFKNEMSRDLPAQRAVQSRPARCAHTSAAVGSAAWHALELTTAS
jgi:hypothetical protein